MLGNFDKCYATSLVYEGGKVNHPDDPGGKTNRGITQKTYTAWLRKQGIASKDVYNITDAEVHDIYFSEYWKPAACDDLPSGVDMVTYDTAINSGVRRAVILLQSSINAIVPADQAIGVDGVIGSKTIAAVRGLTPSGLRSLINEQCNRRLAFMQTIRDKKTKELLWKTFGRGWAARVGNVRTVATSMLSGSPVKVKPNTKVATLDTNAKAPDTDITSGTSVSVETATKAAGASAVGSGVVDALQGVASTFQGLSEVAAFFKYAFIVLTVCLAVYAVYTAYKSQAAAKVDKGEARLPNDEADALMAHGAANVVPA